MGGFGIDIVVIDNLLFWLCYYGFGSFLYYM